LERKPVILLIEDDQESASDYQEDTEATIDVQVIRLPPPQELLALPALITAYQANAVILDEVLQHRSDAAYMGIDAYRYLSTAFPRLPMDILTEYPHGAELKGFPVGNLVRKRDFFENEAFRTHYLQDLFQRIRTYENREIEHQEKVISLKEQAQLDEGKLSKEFVEQLVWLHFETEDSIEQIIWFKGEQNQEVRLLEVNRTAIADENVHILRFAPSEEVPFPVLIGDVRPTEWELIQQGHITLPESWDLNAIEIFERPKR
jgi:hypothetical protein